MINPLLPLLHLDKPVESKENTFEARCFNTAVEISSFADNDGELQVEGTLHDKGDPVEGTFNTETKTFTPKA